MSCLNCLYFVHCTWQSMLTVRDAHKNAWCWRKAVSAQTIFLNWCISHVSQPSYLANRQNMNSKQMQFSPTVYLGLNFFFFFFFFVVTFLELAFWSTKIECWGRFSWIKASALRDVRSREIQDLYLVEQSFLSPHHGGCHLLRWEAAKTSQESSAFFGSFSRGTETTETTLGMGWKINRNITMLCHQNEGFFFKS